MPKCVQGSAFSLFGAFSLCIWHWAFAIGTRAKRAKNWAHQDSNLERAGYEPAALTIELWARPIVQQTTSWSSARPFHQSPRRIERTARPAAAQAPATNASSIVIAASGR